jgi:peptidoglycan/LPS O-acetylase OafA/YrhL
LDAQLRSFFYLIFGAALFTRSREITVVISILAICAAIIAGGLSGIGFLANPISIEFCFGMTLALLAAALPKGRALFLLGLAAWVGAILAPIAVPHTSTAGLDGWARVAAWGIPATVIVASSLHIDRPASLLGRVMLLLGDASYAIYLTHVFGMIAYGWVIKATAVGTMQQLPFVVLVTVACIFGGLIAHLSIEAPLNRILRGEHPFGKTLRSVTP